MVDDQHFWVFGYGSLMWRPGFEYSERRLATVFGYHRSLCIYSHVHRGTPDSPGLVLGLDQGGACCGVAFKVEAARQQSTLAYLREREMVTSVYREALLRARVDDGRQISAIAYVTDTSHLQYAGRLPREELLRYVLQGEGVSGHNAEYISSTYQHLREIGIDDADLEYLYHALNPD
jgi:cation transport protein ChaC